MKKLFLIIVLILLSSFTISAQSECKQNGGDQDCSLVTQSFINDSNKAFQLVVAQREAIEALKESIKSKEETIIAKNETIEAKNKTIERLEEVKCSRGSFMLFIIKWKRCS